jgi:hypothetical protein
MIIVYTYVDPTDLKTYVDFGVESRTDKFVVLPNQELNVRSMGLVWNEELGHFCIP